MAPIAIDNVYPTSTRSQAQTIDSIKQSIGNLIIDATTASAPAPTPTVDLRQYSSFDNSPSIGTEFREFSKEGKPILDIREVLGDDSKLKALGRLVYVPFVSQKT
jgi:hypothetical protein